MTGKDIITLGEHERLDAELRELRAALGELRAPAADEPALRAAFRAQRSQLVAREAPARSWRRPLLASAAVLTVGIAAGLYVGARLGDRDVELPTTYAPVAPTVDAGEARAAAFVPLMYASGLSPSGSYRVVRVRIPLSSLAIGHGGELEGTIEADVLVGEDGLASGIRFDPEDTLLVSTVSR